MLRCESGGVLKGVLRCSGLKARSLCDDGSITWRLRSPQSEVELEFCDDPQIAHALRCQNAADGYRIPASCVSRGIARLRASAPRAIGGPARNARPPAPEPDAAPFTKEELIGGIADCVAALLAQRDEKIAELGGKLDAVLQILGAGKSGDIIDLPKNFWRRDAA